MTEARFDYAGPYREAMSAVAAVDDMFATGEICESERPLIEPRKVRRNGKPVTRWYITLPM